MDQVSSDNAIRPRPDIETSATDESSTRKGDGDRTDGADLIARLEAEQRELVLARFDHADAWHLGLLLVELANARGAAVTIDIRRGGQQLFHYALPGTSPDNDAWIRRKSRVVTRFGASSYLVGLRYRLAGTTLATETGLDPRRYAAYGGSFPLTVAGVGVVGTVTVSGLPDTDDHRLVVDALRAFLVDGHQGESCTGAVALGDRWTC